MNSLFVCLKFQEGFDLIFCNCQVCNCLIRVCFHKGSGCFFDCFLIIICQFYIIISCFFLHDVHKFYVFEGLFYKLFTIGLAFLGFGVPDREIRAAHITSVHSFCLHLTVSDRKAYNAQRDLCSIYCSNRLASV